MHVQILKLSDIQEKRYKEKENTTIVPLYQARVHNCDILCAFLNVIIEKALLCPKGYF